MSWRPGLGIKCGKKRRLRRHKEKAKRRKETGEHDIPEMEGEERFKGLISSVKHSTKGKKDEN